MRNGAFGCSNVIVCYCCSWVGLANTSARGMKQSLSCCGFACCHRTQEMCLFTLKHFDGARRMSTKKSLCRHCFPRGNSGLGIWVTKYWSQVLRPHTQDLFQIILLSGQGLRGSALCLDLFSTAARINTQNSSCRKEETFVKVTHCHLILGEK